MKLGQLLRLVLSLSLAAILGASVWSQEAWPFAITPRAASWDVHAPVFSSTWPTATIPAPGSSLEAFVRRAPKFREKYVVFTFVNYGAMNFTLNWLVSLRRVGVDPHMPVIICMDRPCFDTLTAQGLNAFLFTSETAAEIGWANTSLPSGFQKFNTKDYVSLVQMKFGLCSFFIQKDLPFIYSDTDVVLIRRNPHNAFSDMVQTLEQSASVHALMQEDSIRKFCLGFFVARPSNETKHFFELVVSELKQTPKGHDQIIFNSLCAVHNCFEYVRSLNTSLYIRGVNFFRTENEKWSGEYIASGWAVNVSQEAKYPMMVHANWIIGDEKKRQRLQVFKLWWVDRPDPFALINNR